MRPAARCRVLTCLKLAREGMTGAQGLDELLERLGAHRMPRAFDTADPGATTRLDLCTDLVERADRAHELERDGIAAIDGDLPPGVSVTATIDAELERVNGELSTLVDELASLLPR